MRTDSSLITGMDGASVGKAEKAKKLREERKRVKAEQRTHLTPVAKLLLDALDSEQETVKLTLLKLINPTTPDDQVKSLIVSLNLYDNSITNLRTRLRNILRVKDED